MGRKKVRPSQLIRTLGQSGLTYRRIAEIAKVISGAVGAEMRAWNKEKAEGKEQPFAGDIPEIPAKRPTLQPKTENKARPNWGWRLFVTIKGKGA